MAKDATVVTFPNIERIAPQSFHVGCNNRVSWNGIFRTSDLTFQWGRVSAKERLRRGGGSAAPVRWVGLSSSPQ